MSQSIPLVHGPMTEDVLHDIFASDQDMYPAPLTYPQLQGWTQACPELSVCFYPPQAPTQPDGGSDARSKPAGASIVLPLMESYWRDLLVGKIRETDINASKMLCSEGGAEHSVGLHVFHVERYDDRVKGFAKSSLEHAVVAAQSKGWNILGCSGGLQRFCTQWQRDLESRADKTFASAALTATPEGRRSFEKLGFRATGYQEIWVEVDAEIQLRTVTPGQDREEVLTSIKADSIKGEAAMSVRYTKKEPEDSQMP
ncbi:hypothetical protein JX265_013054 [Neoarthrinium moseri]|uniref:Uncharacterized protein n=1 Tax=Neoarthrinium moseri TaxID=1658444 RepID=A0A9P9W9E5_9PEZI|nr:uncharacterized protein JN550_005833 [Neoarthrinium moseri]KAI1852201.1 hypothetical protein JX265_013054 [Neoarthrinium moseri]KAI1869203.1 hypothetical protein JN550_005833 [Neoarthrinium moseri]